MERFIPVESFRKKGNTFRGISIFPLLPEFSKISVPFVHSYSARLLTVILLRKNAKDLKDGSHFQNVYRYNVCLCSSLVLADVLAHKCNPAGENELRFVVGTCVFLSHSSVLPPELHRGKKCGCWLLVSLTKCGCCSSLKEEINAFSKKKKTISKSSNKTSSTRGSSDAMFLVDMICTQTRAHWNPKIPVKWYGSIYFVSLVEKKCSSIVCSAVQTKPPKIPFKW